jgi:hypothetical protein
VRRIALAIVVALLTFSASGVTALVVVEPCSTYEQPGRADGDCPPTCVTCGCCAQAVEAVSLPATTALDAPAHDAGPFIPRLPKATPRDILHVPKLRLA